MHHDMHATGSLFQNGSAYFEMVYLLYVHGYFKQNPLFYYIIMGQLILKLVLNGAVPSS